MTALETWKRRIKKVPLLARPLRAARRGLRGFTEEAPVRIEARARLAQVAIVGTLAIPGIARL